MGIHSGRQQTLQKKDNHVVMRDPVQDKNLKHLPIGSDYGLDEGTVGDPRLT